MVQATVVDIHISKGNGTMDIVAPVPSESPKMGEVRILNTEQSLSSVSLTLVGAGGAGINLSRSFLNDGRIKKVLFFDTSTTNVRSGESVNIIANGSGSGSNRAENAADIKREVAKLSDDSLGVNDVAIVIGSTAGGSGSVLAPMLIREYARKGVRPIGVVVADTSSTVGAKNTLNTLKTLVAIAENNQLYLPIILVTNDNATKRGDVDKIVLQHVSTLIGLLTAPTYEVDRNDRLNWINPTKVANSAPGVKLIGLSTNGLIVDPNIVLGTESSDMVDSLLILLKNADDEITTSLPLARLKKTGFYSGEYPQIIGRISSDISAIEKIIDNVEKAQQIEQAQSHKNIDRLKSSGSDDLIL